MTDRAEPADGGGAAVNDEPRTPSEDELRAAFEEQLRQVGVEDVILQTVATLVNLGARKLGLLPEAGEDPAAIRDLQQARLAIDGARALAPLCPADHQASIRDALSQLQLAYAQLAPPAPPAGATAAGEQSPGVPASAGAPGTPAGTPPAVTPPPPGPAEAERAKARARIWTPPGS